MTNDYEIWNSASSFDFEKVTGREVAAALAGDRRGFRELGVLLSPAASAFLEDMARQARKLTVRFFGRNITLYTPLYIANHCVNQCVYCGYNRKNSIRRAKLTLEEIEMEAESIAATGLREILLLTGESKTHSSVNYIAEAVKILSRHFDTVGIEVYPMDTDEYRLLRAAGAEYISVYQETYDPAIYDRVHLSGPKKVYGYRLEANQRALAAAFKGASFGALLGLGDFRRDALACGLHAQSVHKKYPAAEIGFSVPRLRSFPNQIARITGGRQSPGNQVSAGANKPQGIFSDSTSQLCSGPNDAELLQVILAFRLFMPWASISLSTREEATFRDNCTGLGVTRLSAGVKTGVGGHNGQEKGDEQFHKADDRDVEAIRRALVRNGWQPVFSDNVRL